MTIWLPATTFAVAVIVIVTGVGPQLKVMIPPMATAWTTAAEVQLAGVPVPMTWLGRAVLTARPAGGTQASPSGYPYRGSGPLAVAADIAASVRDRAVTDVAAGSAAGAAAGADNATRVAAAGLAALAWPAVAPQPATASAIPRTASTFPP